MCLVATRSSYRIEKDRGELGFEIEKGKGRSDDDEKRRTFLLATDSGGQSLSSRMLASAIVAACFLMSSVAVRRT